MNIEYTRVAIFPQSLHSYKEFLIFRILKKEFLEVLISYFCSKFHTSFVGRYPGNEWKPSKELKNDLCLLLYSQRVKELKDLIHQCLDRDPEARLSASCVCYRINELQEDHSEGGGWSFNTLSGGCVAKNIGYIAERNDWG